MDANTPNMTNQTGNSATSGQVTTTESQAHGTAPTSTADVTALVQAAVKAERDSIFAELRRSGVLGKAPKAQTGEQAPVAPTPVNLRALDRALMRLGVAQTLKESALQRMESAFTAENPPDVDAWATDYLDGFGVARPATQVAAQTGSAPAPLNTTSRSDGGSPPPPRVSVETQDLQSMDESDLNALIKAKGAKWVDDRFKEQLKSRKVQFR